MDVQQKENTKQSKEIDFNNKKGTEQPCWTCKNYVDGCSWSRSRGNELVKGSIAYPTIKQGNVHSYQIVFCPEYIEE